VIRPSELDIAALKHDMRELYKNIGYVGAIQVLYEMFVGARVLSEVILEEAAQDRSNNSLE
jgi:hypothetical protein